MTDKSRNILIRTISGAVLLIVVLSALFISQYTFLALLLVIAMGSLWEFFKLSAVHGIAPARLLTMAIGAMVVTGLFFDSKMVYVFIPIAMAMLFVLELYRRESRPLENIAVSVGGIIYAALPMGLLSFIAFWDGDYSPWLVLTYILIVWVNDIFAFLVGMAFGRHKLFERISPKKSWEGFAGGVVFAIAFAATAGNCMGRNTLVWAGLGLTVALSGVLGDLVESMFKRAAGVKDSGSILPGHGGYMDRFDALLLSIPFGLTYFIVFNP